MKELKTSDKGKILKSAREDKTHYVQRNLDKNDSRALIRNDKREISVVTPFKN